MRCLITTVWVEFTGRSGLYHFGKWLKSRYKNIANKSVAAQCRPGYEHQSVILDDFGADRIYCMPEWRVDRDSEEKKHLKIDQAPTLRTSH